MFWVYDLSFSSTLLRPLSVWEFRGSLADFPAMFSTQHPRTDKLSRAINYWQSLLIPTLSLTLCISVYLAGFDIDIQLKVFFKLGKFLNSNFSVPRLDIANGYEVSLVTFSMQN